MTISIPKIIKRESTIALVLSGVIVSGFCGSILGLLKYIADECYCISPESSTKLGICKLGNDAGIIGAAYLYTLSK